VFALVGVMDRDQKSARLLVNAGRNPSLDARKIRFEYLLNIITSLMFPSLGPGRCDIVLPAMVHFKQVKR
jgi:hypothetical protein